MNGNPIVFYFGAIIVSQGGISEVIFAVTLEKAAFVINVHAGNLVEV